MRAHVGNDVVDLLDPHIGDHHRRERFVTRVCTAEEVARVAGAADPHAILWSLFAAKEAAFKVLAKLQPGIAFAPRRFCVNAALDEVTHEDVRLQVRIDADAERVHALAFTGPVEPSWWIERARAAVPESDAVRDLAVRAAATHLGIDAASLRVARGHDERFYGGLAPPRLLGDDAPLPVDLSLSHDGGWVACALLPETGQEPR